MIPNSLRSAINWRRQIQLRREQVEKRVRKRGRTEGKKLIFEEGEEVWVQCVPIKSSLIGKAGQCTECQPRFWVVYAYIA